mmetsp:Transcript_27892/g.54860  ORF Transcript_27892/g.54860 Transcript_27892/m.54860 type:complete len:208 (-) Transcript_27892:614-1237(-)
MAARSSASLSVCLSVGSLLMKSSNDSVTLLPVVFFSAACPLLTPAAARPFPPVAPATGGTIPPLLFGVAGIDAGIALRTLGGGLPRCQTLKLPFSSFCSSISPPILRSIQSFRLTEGGKKAARHRCTSASWPMSGSMGTAPTGLPKLAPILGQSEMKFRTLSRKASSPGRSSSVGSPLKNESRAACCAGTAVAGFVGPGPELEAAIS